MFQALSQNNLQITVYTKTLESCKVFLIFLGCVFGFFFAFHCHSITYTDKYQKKIRKITRRKYFKLSNAVEQKQQSRNPQVSSLITRVEFLYLKTKQVYYCLQNQLQKKKNITYR